MRLAAKMRQLQPDPRATLPPQGQATSRRLAKQQSRIQRQLQRTQRRMHQGRGRHPGIERRVGARLEHAEAVMKRASEALRRSDARRGESLMGEAQQALQQAQELLRQPEGGRSKAPHQSKSAGGSGAQRSGRREAGGRDDRSGRGDDGISRGGRSGMELRSGNSNDDGGDFRRDVMRAMKRSAPAGYGKRVRQYLRALTEDRRK